MGAPTARITAAEFVTPPEFRGLTLATNPAGRIGGVRLDLTADSGTTRLGACYQQVPLRVLPPFSTGDDRAALLYLLNPTAGLLDGDGQLIELSAYTGSRAIVSGQSATRIHPCLHGFSTHQWRIHVEAGAQLIVLPGPTIPFPACRYYQRVQIDLEPGADFVWGDIWLSGRHGEAFQFGCLVQELTVRRAGELVFRDRFCWRGPWDENTAAWHFGEAPASGSVFATVKVPSHGVVFPTAAGDSCVRFQGTAEAVIAAVVSTAAPWLLASHDLAPNHWFLAHSFV